MENNEIPNENIQNDNMISTDTTTPVEAQADQVSDETPAVEQPQTEQPVEQETTEEVPQEQTEEPKKESKDKKEEPVLKQPKNRSAFNGQEEIILSLNEEKENSPLGPLLLIVALIGVVFLLPFISKKIEIRGINAEAPIETPQQPTNPEEDEFYYFDRSSTRAKIGNLEITNLVKSFEEDEYRLSFTLNNVGEKSYDYSKKYYIVMYKDDKVVYRALIHSYDGLGALSATTLSLRISKAAFNNTNKFKLAEIPNVSYPSVRTTSVEGEYDVLTCTYNYNTIKYYLINNELYKIYDEYNESKAQNEYYEKHRNQYQKDSNKYKNDAKLSSVFVETEEDFRMINDIDLSKVSDASMVQLRTYRFFRYKENIKTISFEMEAQGYTCG